MSETVRVPERAAQRILAALERLRAAQAEAQATVQIVADALGVPDGWTLGGDGLGLYFAPPVEPPAGEESKSE